MEQAPPPPHPWYQRRRRDPGHVPSDAADMGTAFGLDLSLSEPSAARALPQPGPTAAPGWAQRMLGRQRSR